MGIRDAMNQHPSVTVGAVAGLLIVTVTMLTIQLWSPPAARPPRSAFFSDDNGVTFFADDWLQIAPFEHNGKQAVAAHVFEPKSGQRFVGYLERSRDDAAKTSIMDARKTLYATLNGQIVASPDTTQIENIRENSQVKRPTDTEWVPANSPEAARVYDLKPTDGEYPAEVYP